MNHRGRLLRFFQLSAALTLILWALTSCSTSTPLSMTSVARHTEPDPTIISVTPLRSSQQPHPASSETETPTRPPSTVIPTRTAVLPSRTPSPPAIAIPPTPTAPPPSPAPPPQPSATSPLPAPTNPPAPQILSFTVAPTVTQNLGDQILIAWQATGHQAAICPIMGSGPVEVKCQDVPLQGQMTFTTDEASMAYLGFALRVSGAGPTVWSAANIHLQCQDLRQWFFDDAPARCPAGPALHSYAAGQYFQYGFMVWVEDTDEFYIFYRGEDRSGFQTFERLIGLQLKPNASSDNRVPEDPPPGYLQPVSGFGLLWRGEVENLASDVRQRLGWATAPEFGYDTAYQCVTQAHPRSWSCYLRGPGGELLYLHPDSTAQVRLLWEEE